MRLPYRRRVRRWRGRRWVASPPRSRPCWWRRAAATATTATSCTSWGPGANSAFGYVDQPPLTPLVARAADGLFGGSLVGLRLPSALAAGLVVLVTGLIAREFGGGRAAQVLAAACMAVSAVLLAVGHLLSTTTFDLLAWTVLSWLLVRALRDGGPSWLVAGAVAGVGLQNKLLPAFLLAAVLVGVLLGARARRCGHRGRGWAACWRWLCGRRTWSGRRRTAGRSSSCPRRSPAAAPAPASRGTCSCRSSSCWSARCWCRCGWRAGGGWPAIPRCGPGALRGGLPVLAVVFMVTGASRTTWPGSTRCCSPPARNRGALGPPGCRPAGRCWAPRSR